MNKYFFDIGNILRGIEKPARYTGGELHSIVKKNAIVRMALCFPDLYEVGMSNTGIQVLYARANAIEGVACERVFAPAPDFEKQLRKAAIPLFTLETRTPLHALDLIGFNLAHELLLTGMLQVLDLGGIPLKRKERNEHHPIIVSGGECSSNPAPFQEFVDAVCVGDGEEMIEEIAQILLQSKNLGTPKKALLHELKKISGIYLPDCGDAQAIRKRVYRLPIPSFPTRPIVPNIRTVQAKAVMEVTRGCANLCSYCHAGFFELPYRVYKPSTVVDAIKELIQNTGYDELTIASLSISDYPYLIEILNIILPWITKKGVSISLPSLRVDLATIPLLEKIGTVRKSSLTFAIESATDVLRQRANKHITISDIKTIIHRILEMGWRLVKLYFMLGLPGCREVNEAKDIVTFLNELHRIGKKRLEMNVTLSPFVPKPHTPFEREPMQPKEYFDQAIQFICANVPSSISIKSHDVNASILEGVIARGDEKLSKVIHRAYLEGCRLDAWKEHFRFDIWQNVLDEIIPNWHDYLKKREPNEKLPWHKIKTGFEKLVEARSRRSTSLPPIKTKILGTLNDEELHCAMQQFKKKFNVVVRARIKFEKLGDARFIPHLDFIEIIKRAMRMADIPVSFTQGFNKRERLSTGYPLPIGIESIAELVDFDLWEMIETNATIEKLNAHLPYGIKAASMRILLPEEKDSLMAITSAVEYRIEGNEKIIASIKAKLNKNYNTLLTSVSDDIHLTQPNALISWDETKDSVKLILSIGNKNSIRIDAFVSLLLNNSIDSIINQMRIVKEAQYMKEEQMLKLII